MPSFNSIVANYFVPLLLPKWRLPFTFWKYCRDSTADQELIHLQEIPSSFRVAIDVGANQGLYSYKMSKHFRQVHAFEINSALTNKLKGYAASNIQIHDEGLSSQAGAATLYIPVLANGFPMTGWASLSKAHIEQEVASMPEKVSLQEKAVRIGTLDRLKLQEVDFVKIDVEGHELEVLLGATETLTANRPRLLVETKDLLGQVDAFLGGLRYRRVLFGDIARRPASPDLHLYVPDDASLPG